MPILSVVVLGLLIWMILRKNTYIGRYTDLFVICCVLKIYWFQGYLFKVGNSEFSSIANFSNHLLLIYSVYLVVSKKVKIDSRVLKATLLFLIVICIGVIYEKIHPYSGLLMPIQDDVNNWDKYVVGMCSMYPYVPSVFDISRSLLEISMFSFEIMVFKSFYTNRWFIYSYMRIVGWLKYGVYYGYLEWIIKNLIGNLTITYSFAEIMLGTSELFGYNEAVSRDGVFYSIQGMTREPSYFNGYLFTLALLMILGNVLKRVAKKYNMEIRPTYRNFNLILCIVLLFFTGGFSAVWFLFIIGCCIFILHIRESGDSIFNFFLNRKLFVLLFVIGGSVSVAILVQNDYFYNRIVDAFSIINFLRDSGGFAGIAALGNSDSIGSTISRFVSLYEGGIIFVDRPLMGLSYRVQPIHDWSLMMLINIGIIGVFFLYKMLTTAKYKMNYDLLLLFVIFMIGGLPVSICPSLLCLYWVLLFEATTFYMNN